MDQYGIGNAMRSMVDIYCVASRQCGKTTRMIENLKDGDRIIFNNEREQRRVQDLCRERGLKVECIWWPAEKAWQLGDIGRKTGRTHFDHGWVEEYYRSVIERASKEIGEVQCHLSLLDEATPTPRPTLKPMDWTPW